MVRCFGSGHTLYVDAAPIERPTQELFVERRPCSGGCGVLVQYRRGQLGFCGRSCRVALYNRRRRTRRRRARRLVRLGLSMSQRPCL